MVEKEIKKVENKLNNRDKLITKNKIWAKKVTKNDIENILNRL